MSELVLKTRHGLCNCLRFVFSYNQLALQEGKELLVLWETTDACNGFFLDYFIPVNGITFVNKIEDLNGKTINYNSCYSHTDFIPDYSLLKLKPELDAKVTDIITNLENDYIAVHIRRTDSIRLAKKNGLYTSDNEFIKFIENSNAKYVYIATDNLVTFKKFKQLFPDKVKLNYWSSNSSNLRHTGLEEAIIDLFVCSRASNFKGSGYSTFSQLIRELRND